MIRVLIAEDEPPTLRRLRRLIEQTDPDFAVVATAGDGEQALEAMAESPCDVVFTDIRMPVMDGLRLMDTLHRDYPDCLVVAVSGHQDFAYVSHAVRAQILDYILKPVSQEAMEELLARVKGRYEQRQREKLSRQLSAHVNRPVSRSTDDSAPTSGTQFGVCLFCAGPMPAQDDAEMSPGAAAWTTLSPEEALHAIAPDAPGFTWEFMGTTAVERIFIFETTEEALPTLARAIHMQLVDETSIPISCASVRTCQDLSGTGQAIRRLRRLLRASIRIGESLFVTEGDADMTDMPPDTDNEAVEKTASLIREGRLDARTPFWRELHLRVEREQWTQQRIHLLFMRALSRLEADPQLTQQAREYRSVFTELVHTALSLDELAEGISGLAPLDPSAPATGEEQQGVARQAEAYLRAHYSEHINTQTLAAAFGYVPSYISILFRKAYGVSPSEYLTRVRLEAAKRLMEEDPHMLIREVAERVGFKSQHHFSRTFKKNEGMWPTSYQS